MKINFQSIKTLVFALLALFAWQTASAAENPYQLMQQASDKLFSDIKANQTKIKQDPNYLKTIIHQDLMPYVHVNYAGSLVLGQYFKSTTPEQREVFFMAFGKFIEQAYAQVLTMYSDQKVQIENERPITDNQVSIRVNVLQTGNQAPIKLNFQWRLNSKTAKWQVYDMSAEGVSMVETKKNEWSNILRKDGIEALTKQIEKAAEVPVTLK